MSYKQSKGLCPLSFGLALGLTFAIGVFLWFLWAVQFGMPTEMITHMVPPETIKQAGVLAGWCFLKGFIFGFFFALIYDCIACCCKSKCCKKVKSGCGCGCTSCDCGNKPNTDK